MGVFAFVILLVLIVTIGRVITERQGRPWLPPASRPPEEIHSLQESIGQLSDRLEKLEEERDFYRALLGPPGEKATLPPTPSEQDPSDEEAGQ